MRALGFMLAAVVLGAALVPIACGSDEGGATAGSGGGTSSASAGTGNGGDLFGDDAGIGTELEVVPATATIDVVDGVSSPIDFEAMDNGVSIAAKWAIDVTSIASVDATGLVTATGEKGGQIVVTAQKGTRVGTATVTVNIKKTDNPAGVTPGDQGILRAAVDPDPVTQWTYPYDKTVFPKGLLAPELMWNSGGTDDLYYVHFVGQYIDFEIFTTAAAPSRYSLDDASWKQLTESGKGGDVSVHVARLVPGAQTATVVVDHTWTIARGTLRGTVYYWANSIGRVVRIKPGATAPEDFLAAAGVSDDCSTCHTVSSDGSTLVIGGDTSTSVFDLIQGTSAFSLGSVGKAVRNWAMPAVSPDGKVLVENNQQAIPGPPGGSDGMWDTYTGQKITGTGLDGVLLDMPAFSPSGKWLAYVTHDTHDLNVFTFDSATNQVTAPLPLVAAGGDPNLNCIAFPSMSPTVPGGEFGDVTSIVYHRGQYSASLDTRSGPGDLYLASVDQPGVEWRLAEANGDAYPFAAGARDLSYNYEPTFAPANSGGYAWVVFTSRRTYGNRLTGGKDVVKQLWVTAVDQLPEAGKDPSHPAFWVPGQDMATLNMRGFWALDPCKAAGSTCGADSECCNGNCVGGICEGPDPNECVDDGDICIEDADCCEPGSKCIGGECGPPPPT